MQYAGPANSSGTTTLSMHFGHGDVTNSQALQPTANAASTTSILRNYRKKDGGGGAAGGEKAQSAEAPPAGEIQGPVARVAPHAHYPKPSGGDGSFRYHQHYADFGMQPAQVVAPPVKYSEIIEPVQTLEHHLARGAVPKPKEKGYFEMACGQAYAKGSYEYNFGPRVINGAYKQQFPANPGGPHHLYHPQHHGYFTGADKNHQQQYLQKDVGASGPNGAVPGPNPPGYGMNYNKMHQYQGRYGAGSRDGNDFLSNLNKIAPDIAQDILNDQHLREQQFPPVYLPDQNRLYTQQRTYQRASNAAAAFGQRNLGYNQYHHQLNQRNFQDNYRFYQNAANLRLPQFEQQPPSDASPRYETQHHPFQNRLGPTFNHCATQLDYQQPYPPRNLHFRQDFPPPMHPKNFFESNPDIPEIVPEDVVSGRGGAAPGKSLKSYLESWNEEAFPDDDADAPPPKEGTLYVLETMEIPSENVPQYIHLQPIEKLPPNVRTLYPENETGANSACKLLQNIAINSQLRQDLGERHPAVSRSLPVLLREEGDDDERPNREDGDLEAKKPSETQCAYDRDKNNEGEDLSTKQPAKTFDAKVLEKINCLFVEHGSLSNEKNPNTVNEIETLSKNDANNPENNDSVTETVVETRQPQTDSTSEDENNVATEFSPTTEESDEHDQKKPYKHFRITDPIRKNQTHPSNSPSNKVFEITSKYFEGSAFDSSPILCLGDDFDHHMCERDRDDEPVPLTFEHSEKRRERAAPEDDGPTSRHTENNTAASPPNLKLALSEDGGTEETVSKLEDPSAATDHDVEDLKKSESPIETGSDSESNRETDCSGDDSDIEQDRTENDDQRKINDGIEGEGSSGSSEESDDCSVKTTNVAITKVNENEHTNETHRHLSRSPGCESEHEQRKEIFHETENVVFDSQTIGNVKEQLREESKSNSNRKRKKSSHSFQDDTHEVYESCLLSTENKILIRKTGNSGKKEDDRVRNKSRRTESWGQNRNIFENKSDLEESSTSLPTKDIVKLNEKQNNELDDGGNEQKIDEDFSPVKSPRPLTAEVGINTENENSLYTKEVVQPNPTHVDNSTNTDINIRHKGEFIKTVDDQKKTNADDEFEESEIADAASFSETLASQTTMKITENFDKAEQNPCESENSSSESESEIKDVASFSETSRKSDEPEVAKQNLCESENTLYSSVLTAALTRSPFVECTNNIEVNNQNFNRSEPDDVKSIPEEQLPSDCARENLASSSINRVEVHNEIESTKNPEDSPKKESIEEEEETSINSPTSTSTTEEEDNDKITPDKETPSNSVLSIETQINDRIIESADEIPAIENPATNAEDYKSIADEKLSSYGNSISSLDDDTDGSEADLSKAETGGEVVIDRNDSASSENIPLLVESTDEVDFYSSELTEVVIEEKDARRVTHEEAEKEKSEGTKTVEDFSSDVSVVESCTKNVDVRNEDELPPDDCTEMQKENTIRPRKKRQAAKSKLTKIIRQLTERGNDKVTYNRDVAEDDKSDDNVQIVTSSREQNNNYETVEEIKSDKAGEEDLSISEKEKTQTSVEVTSFDGEETRSYAEETETSRLKRNINEPGDVPKIKERDVDEENDVIESETLNEGLTGTVGDDLEIAYTEEIIKDLKVTPSDKEEFERPKEEDGNSSEAIELTEEIITTETVQENEIIQEENVSVSVEEKKPEESIDESVILQISKELIQINVTTNDKGEKVISVTPLTKVKIVTSDESQLTFNVDETDGTDDAFLEEQLSGSSSELFTGSEEATPSEGTSPNKETPTEEDGEKVEQVRNLPNDDENPPELVPENRDVPPTETVSKDSKDVAAERDETMPILEPMITQDNAEDGNEVTREQNDTEVENDVPKIKEIEPTITKASKVKKSVNEIEAVPKNCCGTRRPIFRKGDGEVRVRVPKKRLGANIKRTLTIENEAVPTRTTANETRDVNEEPTTMTTAKTFTTTRGKMSNYKIPKKKSNSKNETDPSKSRKFRRIRTFDSRDRKKRGEIKVVNEEENVTKENTIDKEERIQSKENKEKTKSTVESTEGTIEVTSIEVETTKSKEEDGKNSKKRVQFSLEGEVPKRSDDRKSPGRLMKSCLKPTGPAKKQYLDPSKRSFSSRVDEPVIIGDKKRRLSLEEYNIRKKRHVGSEKIEERQYYCFNGERLDGMDFESAKMQEEIEEEVLKNLSSPGGEETAPELEAIRSERATPTRHFVSNFDSDEDDGRDDREASERLEKSVTFVDKSVVEEKINSLEEFLPKIAKASSRRNTTEEISQKIDDLFAERPIYEQRNYDHFLISRFLNGGSLSSDELTKLREIVLKRRRNESKTVNIDFNDFDLRQSHGGEKISPRGKPEPEVALRTKAELKLFEDATETNPNTMFDNPKKELPSNISLYDEDETQEIVMAKPFVVYEENRHESQENPVNDCNTFEREDEPSGLKSYRLDQEVLSEGEANIEKTDDNSDPEEKSELANEDNRLINKPDVVRGQKVLEETRNLHKTKGAEIKRNKPEAQNNLEGYKELDEMKSFANLHKTKGAEAKKNKSEDKNNSEGYKELDEIKTFTNSHKTKGTEVKKSKPEGQNNNLDGYKVLDETKTSTNLHKTESAEVYDKRNCKENNGAEDKLTKRRRKRTYAKDEEKEKVKDQVFKVYDKRNCKEDESEDALAQGRHKRTCTKDEEERKINPDILEDYQEKNETGNLQEHGEKRKETFNRKSRVGSEETESFENETRKEDKRGNFKDFTSQLFRNEERKINTNISTNEIVGSLSKNNDQEKNETRNLQETPSTTPQDVLHKGRRTETFSRKSSVSSDKNESSPNKTGNFQESSKRIRTETSDRKASCVNSKENLSSQNKTYTEDKTVNFREIASERSNRICQETSDKKPSYVILKESESFQNKTHKKDKTGNIEEFPSESSSRIQKETSDKKPSYTNLKKNLSSQNKTCKEDKTGNLQEFTSETSSGVCKETNPTQLSYKEDKTGNLQEFTSESSSRIRKETSDKKSSYVISSISESVQNKVSKEDETRNLQEFTSESFDRKPCCISLEKNKLSQNETYKEDKTGNFKEFTSESSSRIRTKPFNKKPSSVDSVENLSVQNEASKEDKTGNFKEFASESLNKIRTETFNKKPSVENLSFQNETSKEDKTGRAKTFDNSKEEEPESKSHLEISLGTYETFDAQNHEENKQEDEYETKEKKRKITFTEEVTLTSSIENVSNNCERQDNSKHYRSSSESEIHEIETSYFTEVQSTEAEGTSPKDDHVTVTNKNVEEQPIVPTQEQPKKCEREKLAKMNALIQIYKRALENPNATDKVRQIEALIDKVTGGNLRQIRKAIAPTTKPTPRAEYEVSPNRDEMKLHLKKVAGGRRRRKRFRNLYADDSEDEPKFDGYSIVRERSDERAPKLVIKLKKNHGRPYVRLSRLPVLEDMVRKRKRTVFLA